MSTLRLAAVGDLHCSRSSAGTLRPLFTQAAEAADILCLCGDLADYGLPEEAHILVDELGPAREMPVIAVLGNHDYEAGAQDEIRRILVEAGCTVLDGDACEVRGVGFAGVKGFIGGFGERMLGAWGENTIKALVREVLDEALKLESALAKLRTATRIALLHYAPVVSTVIGEPPEIFPFLGCERLAEPLDRYPVTAVFHGHAHRGTLEGRTRGDVPVYNVCLPLLRRMAPERPPFVVFDIPTGDQADGRSVA
jgi:Icc-related predicted phosphoesterase